MAIFATTLTGAGPPSPEIDISVSGLRNMKGNILACITAAPKHFPNCDKDANAVKIIVAATTAKQIITTVPANGTYAIALIHDENANKKMDMALFIPKEGFGFSNNPAVITGPPKFKSASFAVAGKTEVAIKMKYMF